jgi:hypothetical protein
MPYLQTASCERLNILPGAKLVGEFTVSKSLTGPHQEDHDHGKLTFAGPSSSKEFKDALVQGLEGSVERGFQIRLPQGQKYIPIGHAVNRSIITLQIDPGSIEIVEDRFKPGKVKVHFVDGAGRDFSFVPITDLGFYRYAERHRANKDLAALNAFIGSQPEAYIRLGLARAWNNGTINAYWMQVNGIYTFPNFLPAIRSYS